MTPHIPDDLIASAADLSSLLDIEGGATQALEKIPRVALGVIEGADRAGVSLVVEDDLKTVGATDDVVRLVDEIQYRTGEGPCLSSIRHEETVLLDDIGRDGRWPEFSRLAAETGVQSMAAFVLRVSDEGRGALNLYADRPEAFSDLDLRVGTILAAHSGFALAALEREQSYREQLRQLEEALDGRDIIGRAIGILMAREGCSSEDAFAMLRTASQHLNTKLRDIARTVVEETERASEP